MKTARTLCALALCLSLCLLAMTGCASRGKTNSSSSAPSSSSSPSSSSRAPSSSRPDSSSSAPLERLEDAASSGLDDLKDLADPSSRVSESHSGASSTEPTAAAGSADFSQIGALSGQAVAWGPGHEVDAENRPTAPCALQEKYSGYGCQFIGDGAEKKIYLTFDQGYENGYTEKILDTLKEKQVPAVFFLTGHYVNTNAGLIKRMIAEGHTLGNHTNHHYNATEVPLEQANADMMELHDMVKEQFQYTCRLYRFPEGVFSEQGLALAKMNGYTPVFWSFAYADWDPENQPDEGTALEQLTSRLHNGAIYLLHSVGSTNAAILGRFIDAAREQGYTFAVVGG